ncbi:interleukin-like EMT inducer domain-containing protein, partial [Streptococcus thermophilus]
MMKIITQNNITLTNVIDGTDAPTIFVKSYTYSAGCRAEIKLTGPNAFEQTVYNRGHNIWVLDTTTHKLKEFVNCDTFTTMSFNNNGISTTLADYLNSLTDSIVVIAASDADNVDQNFRNVLNKMGGNPELGTWGWRAGHVFIGMSKRSDGTWPLQPRQGYEVAIQKDGSAPEIGCTLSNGGIVANGAQGPKGDQGIPGPKGTDGKTQYIHIAYADTVSGSGFSQTDSNKSFIGIYQDFNAIDSQNPQDYRWSKWKGSDGKDGIPGPRGADGRTPYVHFAYADSPDGRSGFSLTQDGSKRYLGVLTNFIKEDSTNPEEYTWNDTAGSISVGGENLIVNSAFPENIDDWGYWEAGQFNNNLHIATHDFYYKNTRNLFRLDCTNNTGVPAASRRFPVKRNTDYSFNILTFSTGNIRGVTIYFLGRKVNEKDQTFTKIVNVKTIYESPSVTESVKWHLTFNSGDCDEGFIRIDNMGTTDSNTSMLFFAELDCYEGTTDRAWQMSPKDLQEEIDTKADYAMTIAQINRLNEEDSILKAEIDARAKADIVNNW